MPISKPTHVLMIAAGTLAAACGSPAAQALEPVGPPTSSFASRIDRSGVAERKTERLRKKRERAARKARVQERERARPAPAATAAEHAVPQATQRRD